MLAPFCLKAFEDSGGVMYPAAACEVDRAPSKAEGWWAAFAAKNLTKQSRFDFKDLMTA